MTESVEFAAGAFMCSGQGSQAPGMGVDLLDIEAVRRTFDTASEVMGRDIAAIVTSGDANEINDTRNAQAAICTLSVGIGRALMEAGVRPRALLGFSLGQISALALSGMVSDEVLFRIVDVRSRVMGAAADANPGVMSALLKADAESVAALCEECAQGQVLVPANFNSPGQIVISGQAEAVERAEAAWQAQGKRFARLATSGGFHSPLMQDAAVEFAEFLESIEFSEPEIPVICNTDAAPLTAASARKRLSDHLTHPVLFDRSVSILIEQGCTSFTEIGYGGVLCGLVKRIDKTVERACVQDRVSFDEYRAACGL